MSASCPFLAGFHALLAALVAVLLPASRASAQSNVIAWGASDSGQTGVPAGLSGVAAVAAGGAFLQEARHSLALRVDGTVAAWGDNLHRQSSVPAGLSGVVAIAAGGYHSLALKDNGTIAAWGDGRYGQSTAPAGLSGVVAISAGQEHSLALRADGTVVAWGDNDCGQTTVAAGLSGVVAISAGDEHSLALKSDGTVVAWGSNRYGQSTVPANLSGVVAIAAGTGHSLAQKADGTVVAWGYNFYGQRTVPADLSDVVAIAAGGYRSLALKADGTVVAWGSSGQAMVPEGLSGVAGISAGPYHSIAIAGLGVPVITSARRWVTEAAGVRPAQLGFRQRIMATGSPASYSVSSLPPGLTLDPASGVVSGSVASPGSYTFTVAATNTDGTGSATVVLSVHGQPLLEAPRVSHVQDGMPVTVFGFGTFSATGLPPGASIDPATGVVSGLTIPGHYLATVTATNQFGQVSVPWSFEISSLWTWGDSRFGRTVVPAGLTDVAEIATGGDHALALKTDGTVTAWGDNGYGQSTLPAGLSGVVGIAAGRQYSQGLKADGTVVAWRWGAAPAVLSGVVAIAASSSVSGNHSLALKSDGTVAAWGDNTAGQSTVPAGLSGVVAIAAGGYRSLALKADGTLVAWGWHSVPAGLSGVVAIAAGGSHALALKADGSVVAWGDNPYGQSSVPAGLSGVVAIAAGGSHSLALKADGTVVAWGDNRYGQSTVPAGLPRVAGIAAGGDRSMVILGAGVPVITSARRWVTEAAEARPVPVGFLKRIMATGAPTSYNAIGLPPGLTLDPASGVISGAATSPGTYTFTVSATNSAGTGSAVVVLSVHGLPILTAPERVVQNGAPVTVPGVGALSATGLPPEAAVDPAAGIISGLIRPGNYTATLTATNRFGQVSVPWSFEISSLRAWGRNDYGQVMVPPGLTSVAAVAAGAFHSLALKSDGTVAAWGSGGAAVPAGLSSVVGMAAGDSHALALKEDGTVAAWGYNGYGQSIVPPGLAGVVTVSAGRNHSLALRADGTVAAWGHNIYGQRTVPAGLLGIVAIAAGGDQSLALKSDGTVAAWGSTSVPAGLSGVVAVAAGVNHALALKENGTVVSWGNNDYGQSTVPPGLTDVESIAAGGRSSLAVKRDGTVVTWGDNSFGQSTLPAGMSGVAGIAGAYHSIAIAGPGVPVITSTRRWVTEAAGVRSVQTGFRQRIMATGSPASYSARGLPAGLTLDPASGVISGAARSPGHYVITVTATNSEGTGSADVLLTVHGQPLVFAPQVSLVRHGAPVTVLGLGVISATGLPPGAVINPATGVITGLTRPGSYAATVTATNPFGEVSVPWSFEISSVWTWGTGFYSDAAGQGITDAVGIAEEGGHSLVLRPDGTVVAQGNNSYGQTTVPPGLAGVAVIAAGYFHSLALKVDGTVVAWGDNRYGQSTVPAGLTGVVGIAAGGYYSLALKGDGTVIAWGHNGAGQTAVPAGLTGVVAISAGGDTSMALKRDGTVAAWGYTGSGQTAVPAGLTGVVAIAAGGGHSLALIADGTVVGWGENNCGQRTAPAGLTGVVAIAAGDGHSLALRADGTVAAWGKNSYGQSSVPAGLSGVVAIAAGYRSMAIVASDSPPATIVGTAGRSILEHTARRTISVPQFTAAPLPPGLSIHPATGVISGTPQQAGFWYCTITATNGIVTRTEPLTFLIDPAVPDYAAWIAAMFPAGGSAAGPSADPDGDGVLNVMEYALRTDPAMESPHPALVSGHDSAGRFFVEIEAADRGTAVTWSAQFSPDLNFNSLPVAPVILRGAPAGYVRLRFTSPGAISSRWFARLAVSAAP